MSYVITLVGYTPSPRYDGIAWTQAQIAYSATSDGTFSVFDTLPLSPVDSDPSQPASRNFTSSLAPAPSGWFQVTFLDASGGEEPTDPVRLGADPVAQFATSSQLAARLAVTFTAEEHARADTLLQLATGLIQAEAKQTIARVDNDVLMRQGTTDEDLRLPERPVVVVSSVLLNGVALVQGVDYVVINDVLARANTSVWSDSSFYVLYPDDGWGDPSHTLQITYTHGFDPVPADIVAVCVECGVRVWVNPGNVLQEKYGSEEVIYQQRSGAQATLSGLLLTEEEKKRVRDTCRRLAGSSSLR